MPQSFLPGTNPVLSRELRVALRNARSFALISIYVAILGAIVIANFPANESIQIEQSGGNRGRELFQWFVATQVCLILVLLPSLSAGAISQERERQTLEPLLLTPLTPMQVVWGKAAGVLALASLLVLSTLPLSSLCFLLGGVSPAELIAAYVVLLGLALFTASIGLYCSARWHKTIQATIACYLMLPVLVLVVGTLGFVGTPVMLALLLTWPLMYLLRIGGVRFMMGGVVLLVVLALGMLIFIFSISSLAVIATGVSVVSYLVFVTQVGLQQAAREIARAPELNLPLRERVLDLQTEWQYAMSGPPVTLVDIAAQRAPEYSSSTNSGFRIGAPAAVTAAVAEAPPLSVMQPPSIEDSAPLPRDVPDSYGVAPFLSDNLHPILAKDLRTGLLGKFEYLLRFSYVATIGTELLLIFVSLTATASTPNQEAWWFRSWALFHFLMLLIAAAWLGARSIAPEHEQQTLGQLLTTPLTPSEIVSGKIMAVLAYTLYVWVMGLPMVILLLLVGSIKWPAALSFILIELVFSLMIAAWGIYCSIQRVTVRSALGYTLGGLFTLIAASLFTSSGVARAFSTFFAGAAQGELHTMVQALTTMLSPLTLMSYALLPQPNYGDYAIRNLPIVPGGLLLGSIITMVLWGMTMRAFERYAQNL